MRKLILAVALTLSMATTHAIADCEAYAVETDFSKFDLTGDGVVDMADVDVFRDVYATYYSEVGGIGDFNDDLVVNSRDIGLLINAYMVHETKTTVRCYGYDK